MKQKCSYCGGVTYDDKRGNCIACGASRDEANVKGFYNYEGNRVLNYYGNISVTASTSYNGDSAFYAIPEKPIDYSFPDADEEEQEPKSILGKLFKKWKS
jgi:hypothetical protein